MHRHTEEKGFYLDSDSSCRIEEIDMQTDLEYGTLACDACYELIVAECILITDRKE